MLLTFTTVQAIMELRSYKKELNDVENLHDKRLMIDGHWWLLFPYKLYLEKKELKKVLQTSQSSKDIKKIERSKNFLLRSEAWLFIVLGSMFYLISTTIDIASSLIHPPLIVVFILPIFIISTALYAALRFLNEK
ncbi:hypothetical protein [Vagococcus bubulae]|uniref:Uncharacterized protein n=1 Tax=Vagococcus bubulae TaxID=1977868 RepID=A0A429ZPD0_9ENTE|nr:hypothetical protein [Vagococcus bubulae]RST95554.1 hypothetical protein CBF36_02400 [Vagococcus bubulae]